jgi:hypothetical protein
MPMLAETLDADALDGQGSAPPAPTTSPLHWKGDGFMQPTHSTVVTTDHTTIRDYGTGSAWVQEPLTPELGLGTATPRRPRGRGRWWVRRRSSMTVWPVSDVGNSLADVPATDSESEV